MKKSPKKLVSLFCLQFFRHENKKTQKNPHYPNSSTDKDVWFIPLNDTGYLPLKTYLGVIFGGAKESEIFMVFFRS